jgi:GNAT superfamily N-acetyltransferase
MDLLIRGLDGSDAAFIRSLIARQGWNGGLHDVETFATADPDAWLIAELDGAPVGVTLATRWNDAYGWIGVYLVDPDLRGRGIGLALFTRALERRAVGTERRALLRAWLDQPEAVSVAVVDGGVTGFATARPATDGWKVGPVHALDADVAATAIAAAVSHLPPDTVCWLDAPDPNEEAAGLFRSHGFAASPTSGRMVLGVAPPADLSISFALMAHEVG